MKYIGTYKYSHTLSVFFGTVIISLLILIIVGTYNNRFTVFMLFQPLIATILYAIGSTIRWLCIYIIVKFNGKDADYTVTSIGKRTVDVKIESDVYTLHVDKKCRKEAERGYLKLRIYKCYFYIL